MVETYPILFEKVKKRSRKSKHRSSISELTRFWSRKSKNRLRKSKTEVEKVETYPISVKNVKYRSRTVKAQVEYSRNIGRAQSKHIQFWSRKSNYWSSTVKKWLSTVVTYPIVVAKSQDAIRKNQIIGHESQHIPVLGQQQKCHHKENSQMKHSVMNKMTFVNLLYQLIILVTISLSLQLKIYFIFFLFF